jgi:hypothetical protein
VKGLEEEIPGSASPSFQFYAHIDFMSTSIAIIRTGQCVEIAADNAVVDELGNRISLQCKIRQVGDFVYVASKFTLDSANQYDLAQIVANVSRACIA